MADYPLPSRLLANPNSIRQTILVVDICGTGHGFMQRLAFVIFGTVALAAFAAAIADRSPARLHALRPDSPSPTESQCTPIHDALPVSVRRTALRTIETRMTPSLGSRELFSLTAQSSASRRACSGRADRDFWRSGTVVRQSLQSAQVKLQT